MEADAANLRKRKVFVAADEELGLPTPKHLCYEATGNSACNTLFLNTVNAEDAELLDIESTQGSNSFPGDSQSSSTELTFDELFQKRDSSDEASTSWANSRSVTSGNDSLSLENRIVSMKDDDMEEYQISHEENTEWHEIDCLEDCISKNYCKDSKQKTSEELGEFLSFGGVNTALSMLAAERLNDVREAEMGRRKPTIDQEFEQYFSMLML